MLCIISISNRGATMVFSSTGCHYTMMCISSSESFTSFIHRCLNMGTSLIISNLGSLGTAGGREHHGG